MPVKQSGGTEPGPREPHRRSLDFWAAPVLGGTRGSWLGSPVHP